MFDLKREPIHPGEILKKDFMDPLRLSQTLLAKELNTSFRTINEIINKKRNISPEMAIKLSRYFRTSPDVWLNLQNQYDLYRISESRKESLERIKPYTELHRVVNY